MAEALKYVIILPRETNETKFKYLIRKLKQ